MSARAAHVSDLDQAIQAIALGRTLYAHKSLVRMANTSCFGDKFIEI